MIVVYLEQNFKDNRTFTTTAKTPQYIIKMDEAYQPFAKQVEALAKVYDSQGLEKLVEKYLEEI